MPDRYHNPECFDGGEVEYKTHRVARKGLFACNHKLPHVSGNLVGYRYKPGLSRLTSVIPFEAMVRAMTSGSWPVNSAFAPALQNTEQVSLTYHIFGCPLFFPQPLLISAKHRSLCLPRSAWSPTVLLNAYPTPCSISDTYRSYPLPAT